MIRLSKNQRDLFAKGSVDLANVVAGAMVFGQFISGNFAGTGVIVLGIAIAGIFYLVAYRFSKPSIFSP